MSSSFCMSRCYVACMCVYYVCYIGFEGRCVWPNVQKIGETIKSLVGSQVILLFMSSFLKHFFFKKLCFIQAQQNYITLFVSYAYKRPFCNGPLCQSCAQELGHDNWDPCWVLIRGSQELRSRDPMSVGLVASFIHSNLCNKAYINKK